DLVFVAGGIGLAPLRPALVAVLARRAEFGRVVLLYGARTPADILYRTELEDLRARPDVEVHVTVDAAGDDWHGNVGVVTRLVRGAGFDPARALAMLCGPEIMMRYSVLELVQAGMAQDAVYVSLERNMKCAVAFCGHCQYGPELICRDGPVFPYQRVARWFDAREL
ncbi:MAG: Ni/Fe hydrogenase subunit gamma, partial [Gammaproteobacteria bacterium]